MTTELKLDVATLHWASCYVQETAEAVPPKIRGDTFQAFQRVATLLGAAAHCVERGETPGLSSQDPTTCWKGPGSPPGLASVGVLPIVADAMIAQLRRVSAKATPGEWELESGDGADIRWVATPSPLQSALLTPEERALKTEPIGTTTFSPVDEIYAALSVNAVPVLIAEIERLRKLVK
jgi:hypothetical protein